MITFAKPDNIIAMQQKTALKGPLEGTNLPPPNNWIAASIPQKSNEWFTPVRYIEAARVVMGSIDLDPASCFEANQTVRAKCYYTVKDDGLAQEWKGSTWLNPPYAMDNSQPNGRKSGIGRWVDKLIYEYCTGNVQEAIALLTSQANNRWFQPLWDYSICFTDHNIRFYTPFGRSTRSNPAKATWKTNSHTYGCCLVYLGPNNERFAEVFSEFGPVIPANVAVRRQQITPLSLWEVSK